MFVEHHLVDLRASGYTPLAWVRYVRRALAFARERALANPGAVRSILLVGLAMFFATVFLAVLLALTVDPGLARRVFVWTAAGLFPMIGLTLLHVDLVRAPDGTPLDAIGWPTAITLTRVALVPAFLVFMVEHHEKLALFVFVVAIFSDVLDGWIARRYRQETRFGAILDPLVDILCNFWLFVGMWLGGLVPIVPFVLAGTRTAMMLVGGSYLYVMYGPVRVHSTIPGKTTGLILTALVGARLTLAAYDLEGAAHRLVPLITDALVVLLAFTLLYGYTIGWLNWRRLRRREPHDKIVRDVRFGA